MDLELFVLECRAIILRRTSSPSLKSLFRREMRRGSGTTIYQREQREGNDVARSRGDDDATSWRQHRDGAARRGNCLALAVFSVRQPVNFTSNLSPTCCRASPVRGERNPRRKACVYRCRVAKSRGAVWMPVGRHGHVQKHTSVDASRARATDGPSVRTTPSTCGD